MTHLTNDELVDALDDVLDLARRSHLETCQSCWQQVAELDLVLAEARAVDIPEPSPLYWQHLSDRVRAATAVGPPVSAGWSQWWRWPVLAPLAALVLIVMALAVAVPSPAPSAPTLAADLAVPEGGEVLPGDSFAMVVGLVGDLDWETAISVGLTITPGIADRAVVDLTASEQQELTRLLQNELARAKS